MRSLALALLCSLLPAQNHPTGVRTVANSTPCRANWASLNQPVVGAQGGVWLTMDGVPMRGEPIAWRVVNDFFFLTKGRWLIAIDLGRAFPFRMPAPASDCWLTVPLQYPFWPKGTHGMGTVRVESPWVLPLSAKGWKFLCTAVGWSVEGGEFSHVWASETIVVTVQ